MQDGSNLKDAERIILAPLLDFAPIFEVEGAKY